MTNQHSETLAIAPLAGYPLVALNESRVIDNLGNSELQANTLLQFDRDYKPDILFPFMDLSVEAEAIGCDIRFHTDSSPDVVKHPFTDHEQVDKAKMPDIATSGRFPVFIDTVKRLKDKTRTKVAAYLASPFSLAGLMMGAEQLAMQTILDPNLVKKLMAFTTELASKYAVLLDKAGADYIVLLDPTAVILSPETFRTVVGPSVDAVTEACTVPSILHICGDTSRLIQSMTETKAFGFSLDADVDLREMAKEIPPDRLVIGNINPVAVMEQMDPDSVYRETRELVQSMSEFSNFILSTGCDLPTTTPMENIKAFFQAARNTQKLQVE